MAGHDHQQWPLFRLRTNSLTATHTWLESPRRKWQQHMNRARMGKTSSQFLSLHNSRTIPGRQCQHHLRTQKRSLCANSGGHFYLRMTWPLWFYRSYPMKLLLPLPWLQNGCSQSLALTYLLRSVLQKERLHEILLKQRNPSGILEKPSQHSQTPVQSKPEAWDSVDSIEVLVLHSCEDSGISSRKWEWEWAHTQ